MKSFFSLLMLFALICSPLYGQVYKWTDANGKVHYGDHLPADAQPLSIRGDINTIGTPEDTSESESDTLPPVTREISPAVDVVMYATSWCPYCRQAREYFADKGIEYTEYDIEANGSAKRKFESLGGKGVPLILVGGKRMSGFSPERFESLIDG